MKQLGFTRQERTLVALLRWWTGLFIFAAIIFAVFPGEMFYRLNTIGYHIFGWPGPQLPLPSENFWQVLSVSLLILLASISLIAQSDIRNNLSFVPLIMISKLASTTGFILAYILKGPYFIYVVGFTVDGLIFLITWFCYHRTKFSRAL